MKSNVALVLSLFVLFSKGAASWSWGTTNSGGTRAGNVTANSPSLTDCRPLLNSMISWLNQDSTRALRASFITNQGNGLSAASTLDTVALVDVGPSVINVDAPKLARSGVDLRDYSTPNGGPPSPGIILYSDRYNPYATNNPYSVVSSESIDMRITPRGYVSIYNKG